MEYSPIYINVIVKRWEALIGKKVVYIGNIEDGAKWADEEWAEQTEVQGVLNGKSLNDAQQKLYFHNGERVEYNELSDREKKLVKNEKKKIAKVLFVKLKDKETRQVIDNGQQITIKFTSRGLDHFANDAMISLSGKYFSKKSMMRVNKILEKSVYIPTSHTFNSSLIL